MIENEIKRFEQHQLERTRAKYTKVNAVLMIGTILSTFIGWQIAIIMLMITVLGLTSNMAIDTRIRILESECTDARIDKFLKE